MYRSYLVLIPLTLVLGSCSNSPVPSTNSGESTRFCANSIYFVEIIENGDTGGLESETCKQKAVFSDGNSYKYENSVAEAEAEADTDPATAGRNVVWGPRANEIPWCRGEKPARYWIFEDEELDGCDGD